MARREENETRTFSFVFVDEATTDDALQLPFCWLNFSSLVKRDLNDSGESEERREDGGKKHETFVEISEKQWLEMERTILKAEGARQLLARSGEKGAASGLGRGGYVTSGCC